jgi:DUF1365 family protein
MNSYLYKAKVMHHRLEPKKHSFHYNIFMFWLDLDELDFLSKKMRFMSRNRFNVFNFKDSEHIQLPRENPDKSKGVKEQILAYLVSSGTPVVPSRIMLLTNLSTMGYNFNPVSFYYCFDAHNNPLCAVAEVGNTFGEIKPFLLDASTFIENEFRLNTTKHFYVSPFFDHDTQFQFNLPIPSEKLNIRIDDLKEGRKVFISTLTGSREALTDKNLLRYFFSIPFVTIQIIFLIHLNALKLWMKRIPFRRKSEHPELQQGVFKAYKGK